MQHVDCIVKSRSIFDPIDGKYVSETVRLQFMQWYRHLIPDTAVVLHLIKGFTVKIAKLKHRTRQLRGFEDEFSHTSMI